MILVKCDCGCFFTVKSLKPDWQLYCQNCGKERRLSSTDAFGNPNGICCDDDTEYSIIPDNAKFTVTFDVQ